MEKSIEKEFQDLSISDGKITPSKDKDSSSETRSIPSAPKVQSNLYLNLVQSNNLLVRKYFYLLDQILLISHQLLYKYFLLQLYIFLDPQCH